MPSPPPPGFAFGALELLARLALEDPHPLSRRNHQSYDQGLNRQYRPQNANDARKGKPEKDKAGGWKQDSDQPQRRPLNKSYLFVGAH